MHVIRTDVVLRTTRAVEFQRQNERRVQLLEQQPGFTGSLVLNSLGYPVMQMSPMYFQTTKFVVLTEWHSAAAADACFASEAWREFAETHRSEALFNEPDKLLHYETVQELKRSPDRAPFAWFLEVAGGPGRDSKTLEGQLRELCTRYEAHLGPLVESRLLSSQDAGAARYLVVLLLKGQSEFPPGESAPEIAEFRTATFPDDDPAFQLVPEGFQVAQSVRTGSPS